MRSPCVLSAAALALVLAACGSAAPSASVTGGGPADTSPGSTSTVPTAPPASSPLESADPCEASDPCPEPTAERRTILLHGSFKGHYADSLATADQTVDVDVVWTAGPGDVHDADAFVFTNGSYTFSESIGGVCGGSRSEAGPLTKFDERFMFSHAIDARDNASIGLTDARLSEFIISFGPGSSFGVREWDPAGCAGLSVSGVGACPLKFRQTETYAFEHEVTCTSGGTSWTGTLRPS